MAGKRKIMYSDFLLYVFSKAFLLGFSWLVIGGVVVAEKAVIDKNFLVKLWETLSVALLCLSTKYKRFWKGCRICCPSCLLHSGLTTRRVLVHTCYAQNNRISVTICTRKDAYKQLWWLVLEVALFGNMMSLVFSVRMGWFHRVY